MVSVCVCSYLFVRVCIVCVCVSPPLVAAPPLSCIRDIHTYIYIYIRRNSGYTIFRVKERVHHEARAGEGIRKEIRVFLEPSLDVARGEPPHVIQLALVGSGDLIGRGRLRKAGWLSRET